MTKIPKAIYNTEHWGVTTAESRYGKLKQGNRPPDQSKPQNRQDQPTEWGGGDTTKSWITGGRGKVESAESMPGFKKGKH